MSMDNDRVVILGANGVMGGAAAAVFAAAGYSVTMLARDLDKARQGLTAAQNAARAEAVAERITLGTYDGDLARTVAEAGLIFEALAEEIGLKRQFFAQIDSCTAGGCGGGDKFLRAFNRRDGRWPQRFISPPFHGHSSI